MVMPCLNEAQTVGQCIDQAHAGCQSALRELACFRSIDQCKRSPSPVYCLGGLDRDLLTFLIGGDNSSRSRYLLSVGFVTGFLDAVRPDRVGMLALPLVRQQRCMPWHHRYIGNPILSGLGRLLYRTPCRDWHCGLRAFDPQKITSLNLSCVGMEYASEMMLRASQVGLRIAEIPITLHPDARNRAPHLRSVRDGLRHLATLLCSIPKVKFQNKGEL